MSDPRAPGSEAGGRDEPRRVRGGLRLRHDEAALLVDRRSAPLLGLARSIGSITQYQQALRSALAGQTLSLELRPGRVTAEVQDIRRKPHQVALEIERWDDGQWKKAVEAISASPGHATDVLLGEAPESLLSLLAGAGLRLLPHDAAEVAIETDARGARRAVVIGCAAIMAAASVLDEPAALFTLRGMTLEAVQERLRQHRQIRAAGVASAHPPLPLSVDSSPPLEAMIDEFWTAPPDAPRSFDPPPASHISHALLRRMGPSPLRGKFPIVGFLASVYDEVTAERKAGSIDPAAEQSQPESEEA